MPAKPFKVSERHIERAGSDFLALDGWRGLKTDPVSRREWGKGFGEKGMADCLYIRYQVCAFTHRDTDVTEAQHGAVAQVLWIEWKRPGGKAAIHQSQWHMAERARGALVWVAGEDFAADYDLFVAFYRTSGLLLRQGL